MLNGLDLKSDLFFYSLVNKIAELRIKQGMSTRDLSLKANLCHNIVYRLEGNNDINPRASTAKAIADALGVEFDEIFTISNE